MPKAAAAAKGSTGSLKDIMSQEDAKRQQEEEEAQAKALPVAKKGSSWAAKASIGVNPTNYAPAPSVSSPLANSMKPRGAVQEQPQQQQQQPIPAKTRAASREKTSGSNGANSTATGFGGKEMSREMAEWCASNLKKINGSDDITLMQFCMSLNSAIEIREYLAEYLGSSPQVVTMMMSST